MTASTCQPSQSRTQECVKVLGAANLELNQVILLDLDIFFTDEEEEEHDGIAKPSVDRE